MSGRPRGFLRRLIAEEGGQVLPWMFVLLTLFLGVAGLTIDLGRAWVCYRELQASTDAAALAGAYAMTAGSATVSSVKSVACLYSSQTSDTGSCPLGLNRTPNLPSVATSSTLSCVTGKVYVKAPCNVSTTNNNVIQVRQTATIPTYFIQALSVVGFSQAKTLTLNTVSTATLNGSTPPINMVIVLDTTASMGQMDSNCGKKRIQCALDGVRTLLAEIPTCATTDPSTGNCAAYNWVSLFTYPNITASSAQNDYTCGSGNPSVRPYTYSYGPPNYGKWTAPSGNDVTYQVTDFSHDFLNSQGTGLSSDSDIVTAAGGGGCNGLQTPGGEETYYAGAIYAAQAALAAKATATSKNVMIILSDGDANSDRIANPTSSGYGSEHNECQQAIDAAQYASDQGTTVYTIAYGASSGGCSTDSGKYQSTYPVSACNTMKYMSTGWFDSTIPSDQKNFYSDASGATGQCPSSGPAALPAIFSNIGARFSQARLIPNT